MIVVTGAGGMIGSNIVAELDATERGPIIASDYWGDDDRWRNIANYLVEDFVAPGELLEYLRVNGGRIKAVIHMGAISDTTERDINALIERNVRYTLALWDHCATVGIPFLYASSAATYGALETGLIDDQNPSKLATLRPLNAYGWSKHITDRILMQRVTKEQPSPPQWVGLKFFNVYGPNEYHKANMQSVVAKFYPDVAAGRPVKLFESDREGISHGTQSRDFVYVKDCTRAIMWMLDTPDVSGLFNIGTGKARSFRDLIVAIGTALGRVATFDFVPMPDSLKSRYQYFTEADITKLRSAGYNAPFLSVEEGVADYVLKHLSAEDPYR